MTEERPEELEDASVSPEEPGAEDGGPGSGLKPAQRITLIVIGALLLLSLGARALAGSGSDTDGTQAAGAARTPGAAGLHGAQGLVAEGGTPKSGGPGSAGEPEGIESLLPYFTEGSFFALIGFALGYATRKVVKLALVFLAVFFVGLQALSYSGVATVDWGRAIELINDLVLNLKENQTITEFLKDRIPTTGALGAGYLIGFRRG